MLFSSPIFLFLFLPLTLLIYYVIPKRFKNLFLLLCSVAFYTWGEEELVLIILMSTVVDFSAGLIIESGRKKLGLILSIAFNLGLLIYFKYANFIFTNLTNTLTYFNVEHQWVSGFHEIILPLGISFYTFQTMSYTIDVYRGQVKATRNFINFATYVTLFPQLIAGPIVRYAHIEHELRSRKFSYNQFYQGVERFIIGLSKKMLLANNCGFLADGIFAMPPDQMSGVIAWLGVVAYGFQIYYDFSGYSDMAIGLGKMLGFDFEENFNFPYVSKTIQEFWRRWHITLSSWFKDYVYISLGGNRKGLSRTYLNLILVFFITGLWHGADWTFVIWGLYHGFFILLEKLGLKNFLSKFHSAFSYMYMVIVLGFSWILFRSDTLQDAWLYAMRMFHFTAEIHTDYLYYYLNKEVSISLIISLLFATNFYPILKQRLEKSSSVERYNVYTSRLKPLGLLALFIVCCIYVASDSYNPFIYFRF